MESLNQAFTGLTAWLETILFFPLFGFPVLVLWLVVGGVFFTFWLGFPNIRLFRHAFQVCRGGWSKPDDPGQVTHFQSLAAALSGTLGLGNIAGVAIGIAVGGPGAVLWMNIAGFFAMSAKFAEVTLGHKYRKIDAEGRVAGGAFYYLRDGLAEIGWGRLGRFLAVAFAVCCLGGSFGGGNMLQANQAVKMVTHTYVFLDGMEWAVSFAMAVLVGLVLIGGIKRIAHTAEALVPFMTAIYMLASLVVLIMSANRIPEAFAIMFHHAFTPEAAGGGLMGAMIMGFRRAFFSNEGGIGSSPIVHAPAKTTEPVRAGTVALLEPFMDTIVVCTMTGLVITVTGVYTQLPKGEAFDGSLLTSAAFATVIDWFPYVLAFCVLLFAFATIITWSYYGERAWLYMTKGRWVTIYYLIACAATFFGGVTDRAKAVLDFSDLLILAMAIPNLVGVYMLSPMLKREVQAYVRKLKSGQFHPTPTSFADQLK